ncbi:ABC transporter permease [Neisseria sicca]|uniref:ABC transporter permease n=1 Tax=Neisseria sicca TaxID=490 RepID=UPI001EF9D47F|nr:ABC transporter permease [Neisseria sicca]
MIFLEVGRTGHSVPSSDFGLPDGAEQDGGYWAGAYGNIQLDCLPQQAGGFVVFEKMRKLFLRVIVILVLGRLNIIGTAS